ncbi:heavy metal-responsive transcriptional regulator [Actinomadura sp. 3N407]|uniref:heavy metal-responsive transcriptional regulator n=1 Tax=Actinomadura sp. 3N407 TaxID=3457423 RepID=UPI003FCDCD24
MRIGLLAERTGLTTKTLRFYEDAGLLPAPPRTASGYRDYPRDTEARVAFIRAAQSAGLTLAEIRGVLSLRDSGNVPCEHVTDLIDQHLADVERRLAELAATRNALRDLQRRAAATDPADCTADQVCSILAATSST